MAWSPTLADAMNRRDPAVFKALFNELLARCTELASAIGREPGKVAWTMRLAMLAPDIIHRILSGVIPQNLTLEKLRVPLLGLWEEQRTMLFGE